VAGFVTFCFLGEHNTESLGYLISVPIQPYWHGGSCALKTPQDLYAVFWRGGAKLLPLPGIVMVLGPKGHMLREWVGVGCALSECPSV